MKRFRFGGMFFLISCILWLGRALAADCPYKQCTCSLQNIMCNELGLTAMPQITTVVNTYFTIAQFDINNITTVPGGSLPANLSQISFIRNPISFMDLDAFDGSANTLTTLTFFGANFYTLPDAFLHLNVLSWLEISESIVKDWNDNVMKHIGASLNTLSIENVEMNTWPSWMQYCTNLTDLGISGASIGDIPDNGLDSLVNTAQNLELSNNSFTKIPKAVSKMTAVKFLGFQANKISDVSWLPQNAKLESISLFGNRLQDSKQLSTAILPYVSTLNGIELHTNLLTSFPDLGAFTLINELDFRRNKLIDPNSGSVPTGLVDLKLGNKLRV
ncbi:unnamed protein product [Candidula unifasciata]|uniref:Uncharacterized protein n=1 Tax=Candidula unifasciata TaxID=100452 RepID=A0A8S3YRG2_9EUPU|nr:unnamed protein product [Candidula unifasciata]